MSTAGVPTACSVAKPPAARPPVGVLQPTGDACEAIPEEGFVVSFNEDPGAAVKGTASAGTGGKESSHGVKSGQSPSAAGAGPMLLGKSESAAGRKESSFGAMSRFSHRVSRGISLAPPPSWVPRPLVTFVRSQKFELFMAMMILCNCILIGVEADNLLSGKDDLAALVSEHIFTFIFVVELFLRTLIFGWRRFIPRNSTAIADLFDAMLIILTGVVPMWVLPFCGDLSAQESMKMFTVLRSLRLIRAVRVLRSEWFQEVWVLLRGMIESMRMLFWTVVVIAFITYIFAIFGVVTISAALQDALEKAEASGDERSADRVADLLSNVNGVASFMMTLVQVLTLDSWTALVREVSKYSPRSWIFFYLYVSLAVLVLMNIVTAVLVDRALVNSNKDAEEIVKAQEKEKEKAFKSFRMIFREMDTDGSGDLTRDEFQAAFADQMICAQLRAMRIEAEDVEEIFALLDSGDGVLSLEEFFDGIQRMEGVATAKDLFRLLKKVERLNSVVSRQLTDPSMGSSKSLRSVRSNEEAQIKVSTGAAAAPCTGRGGFTQPGNAQVLHRLEALAATMSAYDAKVDRCLEEIAGVREGLNLLVAPSAAVFS